MTDHHALVAATCDGLADALERSVDRWDEPSLCEGWPVRAVVAHMTMAVRLTPERFGAEMAAAGGDFHRLSDTVALRDAGLPREDLLGQLRSTELHAWEPPGGGAAGALTHAVVHSLDATVPLGLPAAAPPDAVVAVLDLLTGAGGAMFGVELGGLRLEATDTAWGWGAGEVVSADSGSLVSLLAARTLPGGRALARTATG
ncbi:uncharacterized protein (TIGR03083 family) [Motilibacter peucedani]|uniref:Uncharacterized protein (TIGR03083 family) n=1 Tax=Motilibacter peucedani TaxID=598650 RepID=A0A420XQU7_9ACTN|nr:maleylpyruvate isomerase family mycothiol-dependent enzyme [Motilibacter peucedani]RKS75650.1 uncharacterized protein (TIGR03083 family) [Motilibacter peucedani]